nr:hypothetical protein [Pseudonocardia sp. AL041005-10]
MAVPPEVSPRSAAPRDEDPAGSGSSGVSPGTVTPADPDTGAADGALLRLRLRIAETPPVDVRVPGPALSLLGVEPGRPSGRRAVHPTGTARDGDTPVRCMAVPPSAGDDHPMRTASGCTT